MKRLILPILAIMLCTSCKKIALNNLKRAKEKRGKWKLHLVEKRNMKDGTIDSIGEVTYLYNFIDESTVARRLWGSSDTAVGISKFKYNIDAFGRVWIQFNPDAGPSFVSETYTLSGINKTHEGWTSTHNVMNPMGSDIQSVVLSGSLDKLK
jgi:hypothetical protein